MDDLLCLRTPSPNSFCKTFISAAWHHPPSLAALSIAGRGSSYEVLASIVAPETRRRLAGYRLWRGYLLHLLAEQQPSLGLIGVDEPHHCRPHASTLWHAGSCTNAPSPCRCPRPVSIGAVALGPDANG